MPGDLFRALLIDTRGSISFWEEKSNALAKEYSFRLECVAPICFVFLFFKQNQKAQLIIGHAIINLMT